MADFFKFGRNEKCPCGSEKKYKKCCGNKVDELAACWRNKWPDAPTGLVDAVALAFGMRNDDGETWPDTAKIERAMEAFQQVLDADDEDELHAEMMNLAEGLSELFVEDDDLRNIRFSLSQIGELSNELEREMPGLDEPAEEDLEKFFALGKKYIQQWVKPARAEDLAWELLYAMRREERDERQLQCLILGLIECQNESISDSLLWQAILKLSFIEANETIEAFEKLAGDDSILPEEPEKLAAFLEQHPMMDKEISRIIMSQVEDALAMVVLGHTGLAVPLYGAAGIMSSIALQVMRDEELSARQLDRAVPERIYNNMPDPDLERVLAKAAWELDYDILVPLVQKNLSTWLETEGADAPEEIRQSVQALNENFGISMLEAHLEMFHMFCRSVFFDLAEQMPVTVPPVGDQPGLTIGWSELVDAEALGNYARYLEKTGNREAAGHVRKVTEELGLNGF